MLTDRHLHVTVVENLQLKGIKHSTYFMKAYTDNKRTKALATLNCVYNFDWMVIIDVKTLKIIKLHIPMACSLQYYRFQQYGILIFCIFDN